MKAKLWLLAALTAILLASASEANAFFRHVSRTKTVTVTTVAPVAHVQTFQSFRLAPSYSYHAQTFRLAPSYSYHMQTFSLPRVGYSYGMTRALAADPCYAPAPAPVPVPVPVPTNDPVPPPQPLPPVQLPAASPPPVQQVPVPVMPYAASLPAAPAPTYGYGTNLAQLGRVHYGYHRSVGVGVGLPHYNATVLRQVFIPHATVTAALGTTPIVKQKTVVRGRFTAPPAVQVQKQKAVLRGRGRQVQKTKTVIRTR